MTDIVKPSEKPRWATDMLAAVTTPPIAKQDIGWIVEYPPHQFFNWLHRKSYDWLNYFEAKGDTDLGGVAETTLTIASGSITPIAGIHSVDTEGGAASDDLANIVTTNLQDGRLILIRSVSAARVITLKHNAGGAGQIALTAGIDLILADPSEFVLLKRTGANWEQVFTSQVGSDVTPFLGGNLDVKTRKIFSTITNGDIVIEPNGTGALTPETTGKALGKAAARWNIFGSDANLSGTLNTNTIDTPNASETLNIGNTRATTINIGRIGATIAFYGSVTEVHTTNTYVSDKIVTLNDGGLAASGGGVGIEVEENALITGYIKTSANRNKWSFLSPNSAAIISVGTEAAVVGDIGIVSNEYQAMFTGYGFKNSAGNFILRATDGGKFTFGISGGALFHEFHGQVQIRSNTTNMPIELIRTANSANGGILFTTGSTNEWILGLRNTNDSIFRLYSLSAVDDILQITQSGIFTFGPSTGLGLAAITKGGLQVIGGNIAGVSYVANSFNLYNVSGVTYGITVGPSTSVTGSYEFFSASSNASILTQTGKFSPVSAWTFGSGVATETITHTFRGPAQNAFTGAASIHSILRVEGAPACDSLSVLSAGTVGTSYNGLIFDRTSVKNYLWSVGEINFVSTSSASFQSPITGMAGYSHNGSINGSGRWIVGSKAANNYSAQVHLINGQLCVDTPTSPTVDEAGYFLISTNLYSSYGQRWNNTPGGCGLLLNTRTSNTTEVFSFLVSTAGSTTTRTTIAYGTQDGAWSFGVNGIANFHIFEGQIKIKSVSTNMPLELIRTANSGNGGITFTTGSTNEWIFGLRNTGNSSFRIYCNNIARDILEIATSGSVVLGASGGANATDMVLYSYTSGAAFGLVNRYAGSNTCVVNIQSLFTSGAQTMVNFNNGTPSVIGNITWNGTTMQYLSGSDARLKTNHRAFNGLELVKKIEFTKFEMKSCIGTDIYGTVAQKLYNVLPQAVGVGDDSDVEIVKKPWSVDYGQLTPILGQAIQELEKMVFNLRAEIEVLKAA